MYKKDTFLFYMRRRSDVSKRYLSLPHVNGIRCIKILAFSSTREGVLIHLISFASGRERYPFDTSDLLHVWKRKISF
jgi:hypothetical protein